MFCLQKKLKGHFRKVILFLIIASLSIQSDNLLPWFANKIKFGGVKHLKTQGQLHEHPGWVQHFNMQCEVCHGLKKQSIVLKMYMHIEDVFSVIFCNKRSQAKGVYYVFLYKQHMDNATRVAIHRFTLGSLVVG